MNAVLSRHSKELADIKSKMLNETDDSIADSEQVLQSLGYDLNVLPQYKVTDSSKKELVVPSWESIRDKSVKEFGRECELDALFTDEELNENEEAIKCLNAEYNQLHRLDAADIAIAVLAGLIGSTVDILLVGIPHKTTDGLKAAPLSDYIRNYFDKKFPEDEMQKLANSKVSKVPFDAQDNRNTSVYVDGLSSYYHRLLQLGHDPLLGFVFGVYDILNGKMTTVDKTGKFVSQLMENYADRKEVEIFAALSKLIIHFKSDITTSMGLPAPLMGVFNLFQFGSIGEEEQTIAQIVQGMYYEGYDFIHFCSMSVPAMLIEVIIRLGYAIKRVKEGCSIKDSVPMSLNREKHPKL